jgi:hypothetical protein
MRAFGWAVLGLLLAATLVAAASFDRRRWPQLVGDEATYLMQAESLAWDFDLRYERADYDRFLAHWGRRPEGLILQSSDGGRSLTYGKPALYALAIAPFVRLSPVRGPAIANALYLAAAAIAAAFALERRLGSAAALWVAVFVFASVTFAHVFWAHSDLFLMSLVAVGLALVFGARQGGPGPARWAAAGALLAAVAASRPFYASLLAAAALAAPRPRRRPWLALAGGAAAVLAAVVIWDLATRGTWTSYGAERQSFYGHTGFPAVDPVQDWGERVRERGPGSWVAAGRRLPYEFQPRIAAYDALYFLVGRHVGIVPYFLPVLLALAAFRPGGGRGALLLAALATGFAFYYVRPFNFYGGGGALANRYFLPVYPAFWFLAARPLRPHWPLLCAAAAAPFLWPLWRAPRAFPFPAGGGYAFASPAARRGLPYETTQSHLKPAGRDDFAHRGLWLKPLGPEARPLAEGAWIELGAGRRGELLVGANGPLSELVVTVADGELEVEAGGRRDAARPDGFTLRLDRRYARHPMWWTRDDVWLYRLVLRAGARGAARFALDAPEEPG